jgi:DNA (cytosine-5)-methyltransferase 1
MKYINLEYHPADSRIRIVELDVSQTLNQRMGTGGGNVPLIVEIKDEDTDNS